MLDSIGLNMICYTVRELLNLHVRISDTNVLRCKGDYKGHVLVSFMFYCETEENVSSYLTRD